MSNNIVAVMAKHPELSQVKTRLAKTLGDLKALEVYKILLDNLCENCLPKQNNQYTLGAFITPTGSINDFQLLYNNFAFYNPQNGDNLGERMQNALQFIFSDLHADKAILIGADIPDLDRNIIDCAFDILSTNDVVIGPTDDGGYYLLGIHKVYSEMFQNIRWGTSTVLDQTLKNCKSLSLKTKQLQVLSDLDIQEDLKSFPQILSKMQ